MQFEPPNSPYTPFPPYHHQYYPTPPPGYAGSRMYEYSAGSIPTPAPSPRAPHHTRRRSHDYTSADIPNLRRAATDHTDYHSHEYATPPPPRPHTRAGASYMHTPLHTPPPTSHGPAPPFFTPYMPGFGPQSDYFTTPFTNGPHSPPPRDRTRSVRSHRRESTWAAGQDTPRSPRRQSPRRARTTPEGPAIDPEEHRAKAKEHGIPTDYSLKNWDPKERPIILLGSVFDANSLGEWIFNWTKFHHGRQHDATKVAGQLWELLIALGGKLKRAREFFGLITRQENREIVEDFLDNGERLWSRLKALLSACEKYMWNGAKSSDKGYQMGKKSGAEFVEAMFSADKEWTNTEQLMRKVKTWNDRFEVNCEEILRRPDA